METSVTVLPTVAETYSAIFDYSSFIVQHGDEHRIDLSGQYSCNILCIKIQNHSSCLVDCNDDIIFEE